MSERTKTQGKLRAYKHIERNQGKQQQVRSNQTQMGTHELMMTERGQEGPYMALEEERHKKGDTGLTTEPYLDFFLHLQNDSNVHIPVDSDICMII